MPKIIKDGITYGAAPSSEVWEGTQAQYDALTTKDPDVTYFITDSDPAPATNAAVISYDNTDSGLYAVNVQQAIDEVDGSIKALETKSVTITPSSGITLNYSSMGVSGKLVACSLITKTTFTAGTWKEIGYISKVPTDEVKVPCANNTTGAFGGMARIETTGKVTVYPQTSGEYAIAFSIAYITT